MVSRISRGTANQRCVLCLNEPVGPDYPFTSFQFMPCSHIFCIGCTKEKFQALIVRKQLEKIHCFTQGCDSRPPYDHLELIFQDDSQVLEKLKECKEADQLMLNNSASDVNDLARICPKKECPGVAIGRHSNEVSLECPVCNELICFECH